MPLPDLYRQMLRARLFELGIAELWREGRISGEMHLGTGEEAIAAGVVGQLRDEDALSLTHRSTAALVVRGVPLVPMVRELLGREDGLGRGRGGHMHLCSREHLAASSGIVGASIPVGAGFALAARRLRPGSIAVAFMGTGAMDQGMALEGLNLVSAWRLPLVIVCIDNGWAITTVSGSVTAGDLVDRAAAFGLRTARVDGTDAEKVHATAAELVGRTREGQGPAFLLATCPRLDGHFLGDLLPRAARAPIGDGRATLGRVLRAALTTKGAGPIGRAGSLGRMVRVMARARREPRRDSPGDPLTVARRQLQAEGALLAQLEAEVEEEIDAAFAEALGGPEGGARG